MAGSAATTGTRARGVVLLMTLLLVVLLVSVVSRLATSAAVDTLGTSRRANTLQHELARDSAITVIADRLESDDLLAREFERNGEVVIDITVGACSVHCRIVSDAGKFNVNAFADESDARLLERKLRTLQRRLALPQAAINPRPVPSGRRSGRRRKENQTDRAPYIWFDQLFTDAPIGAYFTLPALASEAQVTLGKAMPVWSDCITLWGDGRVDIRYAHPEVVRVLLEDIDRGASEAARSNARSDDAADTLSKLVVGRDPETRSVIERRIGAGIDRYALTIDTAIDGDLRRWYVVADMSDGKIGRVHYRGQVRW